MQPQGEVRLYRSKLFDSELFWHGFPERSGGYSDGPRASLNLGMRWGDSQERVEANRRRVAETVGFRIEDLVVTKHVHGTDIWVLGEDIGADAEFDGIVSAAPGKVLGAFAADCIPLLFAAPAARLVGAAHAGWRGTVNGMAARMVEKLVSLGAERSDVRAALGPSIGPCCFEVGDEVVEEFTRAFPDATGLVVDGSLKKHIDLRVATVHQLQEIGIDPTQVDADPPCTMCNPERFFSYRRDGKAGGVHMGFIGLRP
jgi:YfiH family protein